MSRPTGTVRIGLSGWRYPPWRGVFYPTGLAQRRELAFASRMLPSIEINGSFYSLQRPECIFRLGAKLGPFLWQFPPQLGFDAERFDAFFSLLPRDSEAALALAREHDQRLDGRAALESDANRPLRHAVEIRHPSFVDPAFIALLRRHRVALVVADTAGRWPLLEDLTADFVYLRLHGDEELYASGYGDAALDGWAARIATWRAGRQVADARLASPRAAPARARRDVYCYFDNDVKVHAPYDAAHLAARLGVKTALVAGEPFVPPPGMASPRTRSPPFRADARQW